MPKGAYKETMKPKPQPGYMWLSQWCRINNEPYTRYYSRSHLGLITGIIRTPAGVQCPVDMKPIPVNTDRKGIKQPR